MEHRTNVAAALALILAMSGCNKNPSSTAEGASAETAAKPEAELMQRAQASLRGGVGFDPVATQFRNVYVVEGNVVCGEINWTDAAGKLRGFVPFMYRYGIEVKDNDELRSARFVQVWQRLCEERAVTFGDRAPLPDYQRQAFAQRLQALQASGGAEQPSPFHGFYWKNLDQIDTDLKGEAATAAETKAAEKNAEAGAIATQLREAATKRN